MLYDNWLSDVTRRFQAKFDQIQVTHNFDYGTEFEVAVGLTLRELLPRRFGVCRGFVLGRDGTRAGDDIIVFDALHFPTVRALSEDLSRKEAVPAEAVLAYIEAKHTLRIEGEVASGQSLAKAMQQVAAAKCVERPRVEHRQIIPGVNLAQGFGVEPPESYPRQRNPYYAAIWARHVSDESVDGFQRFSERLSDVSESTFEVPDAIVAGSFLAIPGVRDHKDDVSVRPFVCEATELVTITPGGSPWGIAVAHMLWAIEWVRLGEMPWPAMLTEQLAIDTIGYGDPPMRGIKYK